MTKGIERLVRERAGGRCEYCRLSEAIAPVAHVVDHVRARQHHGLTELPNLALACVFCNRFKGPNLSGVDPKSDAITRLYDPRVDVWEEHFAMIAGRVVGVTSIGRATVDVLQMNDGLRVALRLTLQT
ncbi:MAG: HNH endonuclease [Phycisphaerae bacterium]|nr:HNH endonuclease signature motif containing protein [Tepidisphaeraceae bacterium]